MTATEIKAILGLSSPTAQQTAILGIAMPSAQDAINTFLGYNPVQDTYTEYYPEQSNAKVRSELIDAWERSGTNKIVPVERYVAERRMLVLRRLPVRTIVSVYENPDAWLTPGGSWPADTLLAEGDQWVLDVLTAGISWTGFLIRNVGPWSIQERCVKVTYTAGLTQQEIADTWPALRHAYMLTVQTNYNEMLMHIGGHAGGGGVGAIVQEHLADWGVQYDQATNALLYGMGKRMPAKAAQLLEQKVNLANYF